MRAYSDDNPTPFLNSAVQDASPVFNNDQGSTDSTFGGVLVRLVDGRTTVILDPNEVRMIKAFAYLGDK